MHCDNVLIHSTGCSGAQWGFHQLKHQLPHYTGCPYNQIPLLKHSVAMQY